MGLAPSLAILSVDGAFVVGVLVLVFNAMLSDEPYLPAEPSDAGDLEREH